MGDAGRSSFGDGTNPVGVGREDREAGNRAKGAGRKITRVPGKIIRQLIEQLNKELAYHSEQVQVVQKRITELDHLLEGFTDQDE